MSLSSPPPEPPARILVVEDDPAYRSAHAEILRGAGHAVDAASDGHSGLQLVTSTRPDLVLTDWEMPQMDGMTLCRLIKGSEELRSTYVVLLSVRGSTSERVAGLDVGADDYLVKPVEPVELLARVRSGLRLRRALAELAAKNELLSRLALTDPLTGLANRRAWEEALPAELSRALRHCSPLSLLYLDVDTFKHVNDTLGHPAGDEVLVGLSELLRRHARRGDLVARIGGDEFGILLPHTAAAQAFTVAERLRRTIASTPLGRTSPVSITASLGVALFRGSAAAEAPALAAAADAALYRAKSLGRNRVELEPGAVEPAPA